jgi:nucleotide-binding universal stress UspA family protein
MNKVIVGFDRSAPAVEALHLGAGVAKAFGAKLVVACVDEHGPARATDDLEYFDSAFEAVRRELGDTRYSRRDLPANAAGDALARLAAEEGAGLIVVGRTHRGVVGRAVPGTAAAHLFCDAPCPVMIAPHGWSRHPHAGLGQIGVGFDGSLESRLALDEARWFARELGAALRLIAVRQDADPTPWKQVLAEGERLAGDDLEVEAVLVSGREANELATQAVELDLLVVGSRGRGPLQRIVLGSVADELARTAPCPVVVTPRGSAAAIEHETSRPAVAP